MVPAVQWTERPRALASARKGELAVAFVPDLRRSTADGRTTGMPTRAYYWGPTACTLLCWPSSPAAARRRGDCVLRRMSGAGAAAPASGEVPTSAPELRDVSDAPAGEALRTYETQLGADELLRQFLSEISDVARDAEVVRCVRLRMPRCSASRVGVRRSVVSCFKLNPYEHLNLRFDSTIDEVKRQYRKACTLLPVRLVCRSRGASVRADIAFGTPRQVQTPSCPRGFRRRVRCGAAPRASGFRLRVAPSCRLVMR